MKPNWINFFLYFMLGALILPLPFWQIVGTILVVIFIEKNAKEGK